MSTLRSKQNIDVMIREGIEVTSWYDMDFEISFEDNCDSLIGRYLTMDEAKLLHDALGQHIKRFA